MKFVLLINLKLLTLQILSLLNSAEHEIFSANKHENANNILHFHISRKFHAQLCLARKNYLESTFLAMHVVYVRSMNCTGE